MELLLTKHIDTTTIYRECKMFRTSSATASSSTRTIQAGGVLWRYVGIFLFLELRWRRDQRPMRPREANNFAVAGQAHMGRRILDVTKRPTVSSNGRPAFDA